MNWVAWQKVVAPIEYGGLGFGSLRDINSAMLAKWWWRFKNDQDGLWRKTIWAIHNNSRMWNTIPIKLTLPGPWKQVAKSMADLNSAELNVSKYMRGVIGRGNQILFWLDNWCGEATLASRYPRLFAIEKDRLCKIEDRVHMGVTGPRWNWEWKKDTMDGPEVDEWLDEPIESSGCTSSN
ncbi:uncharacterized protein LOC110900790 [Helianthus annuus]|uniref:uncharacterized protein LOC110900790 n=1 Tax=Helianthus annuus TaxID=4232 RepID=UPI000B8F9CCD|nr:uncharacterized protein LOC110900790 [Helianthus annuus]